MAWSAPSSGLLASLTAGAGITTGEPGVQCAGTKERNGCICSRASQHRRLAQATGRHGQQVTAYRPAKANSFAMSLPSSSGESLPAAI